MNMTIWLWESSWPLLWYFQSIYLPHPSQPVHLACLSTGSDLMSDCCCPTHSSRQETLLKAHARSRRMKYFGWISLQSVRAEQWKNDVWTVQHWAHGRYRESRVCSDEMFAVGSPPRRGHRAAPHHYAAWPGRRAYSSPSSLLFTSILRQSTEVTHTHALALWFIWWLS